MIVFARPGQRVRLRYNRRVRDCVPYHDRTGTVVIASTGKPRNHLVRIDDGPLVVVPCGNLKEENPRD